MSRAEDQPWSPYPVQDWSRLPEDPLAVIGGRPQLGTAPAASALVGSRWWC